MTYMAAINIALEILGSTISLILILFLCIGENRKSRLTKLFVRLLACNSVLLLLDAVSWWFKGSSMIFDDFLVRIANFLVFALGHITLVFFTEYIVTYIGQRTSVSRLVVKFMAIFSTAAVLFMAVLLFGPIYHANKDSMIYQQFLFWFSQAWGILGAFVNAAVVVRYRRFLNRREKILLPACVLAIFFATIIRLWVQELALMYIATTLVMIAVYAGIQADIAHRMSEKDVALKQKELQLAEGRTAIMLSQIQPHFLYNSLTAIEALCATNPAKAKTAINDFAHYLRGNLDSLNSGQFIRFDDEMEHVETYLGLEQLRFEENLRVKYDIQIDDFFLPPLTVQPIVENAVRHGIAKKEGGGTIAICSEDAGTEWRIAIIDDGIGFDTTGPVKPDGRSHIGIATVQERLAALCGGRLDIESTPGKGTCAVISIPKHQKGAGV